MTDLMLRPLADAFMEVTVFVAVLLALFGWARSRWGDRLDGALVRHARMGPLVGAAATMPPGCGGAILVMTVYSRGCATFGTAVAALCATMGDATWILLAAEPVLTLQLKALLFATGAVTGYAVDLLGIAPRRRVPEPVTAPPEPSSPRVGYSSAARVPGWLLWVFAGVGFAVSLPVTFNVLDPATLAAALGGLDLYLLLGTAGTVVAVTIFVRGRCRLSVDRSGTPPSLPGMLRQGQHEVAFVTVWVAVAYLAWHVVTSSTGFDGSRLPLLGLAGVTAGALIGLIPGCGVQIVFTGIFLAGGMPLPTLVANCISQDGDALLPLLALERRSAVLATVLTTVPAICVGAAGFLLVSV